MAAAAAHHRADAVQQQRSTEDELNVPPGANLAPVMIGLVVVAIGMSFGGMHGYPINPARDFGPRLFTAMAGFKNNGLTDGARVWWVPVFAPLLGGLGRRGGLRFRHSTISARDSSPSS